MYNTKYKCRYNRDDIFIETDVINEEEKDLIRDVLYREDLLHIFYIDHIEKTINFDLVISELYKTLNTCDELIECMQLCASRLISENIEMGLCIMYSYDFMYLTHKCVCSYLENGEIPKNDLVLLRNKL